MDQSFSHVRYMMRTPKFACADGRLYAERPETPPNPSSSVPFRRDPDFVDRRTLLDQIGKKCSIPASITALVGLGGVG